MGERGEVVAAVKTDDTGSVRSSLGSSELNSSTSSRPSGLRMGRTSCRELAGALRHPHQQPGSGLDIGNTPGFSRQVTSMPSTLGRRSSGFEDGVLFKALCEIVHREPVAVLEDRAIPPTFSATRQTRRLKPLISLEDGT